MLETKVDVLPICNNLKFIGAIFIWESAVVEAGELLVLSLCLQSFMWLERTRELKKLEAGGQEGI